MKLNTNLDYTPVKAYSELHQLLLNSKLCHYKTRLYPSHQAFGLIYDSINELIDDITEQLIGYSNIDPEVFEVGTVVVYNINDFALKILGVADRLIILCGLNKWYGVENLAQELHGLGAKLKYLSRFEK